MSEACSGCLPGCAECAPIRELVESIRRCLRCQVHGPGAPIEALCPRHRARLDELIPTGCADPACTACPPRN